MRPLAEVLATAGFAVELPLLPGHGTAVEDMEPTRWEDWTAAAASAYDTLCERCDRVMVTGLSMGGSLSCWLAARHVEIAGLALVNPLIEPPAPEFTAAVEELVDDGTELAPGVGSDIAKEGAVELAYSGTPLRAALSLFDGVAELEPMLPMVTCPVLLLSSRQDHVVAPASGDLLEARVGGPIERVWLERSYHVATLDFDAPVIEERVLGFAREVLD
jgi:carboxylesterase